VFAILQLRGTRQEIRTLNLHHAENHEWNRRIAAQEALRLYNYNLQSSSLRASFDYLNCFDSIPLETISKEFEANKNLQSDLHELLNFFEALARGIHQGLFDELVIKSARRTDLVRCERAFRNYIDKRRDTVNSRVWVELSHLAAEWANEENSIQRRLPPNATSSQSLANAEVVTGTGQLAAHK